jgi:hypothetical protein
MKNSFMKNVGLFFAAPFIALAYVIALPFVGMYMFTNLAIEASAKKAAEATKVPVQTKQHI